MKLTSKALRILALISAAIGVVSLGFAFFPSHWNWESGSKMIFNFGGLALILI